MTAPEDMKPYQLGQFFKDLQIPDSVWVPWSHATRLIVYGAMVEIYRRGLGAPRTEPDLGLSP